MASGSEPQAASVDWLALCRDATEDVRAALDRLPGRLEREPILRTGVGGDDTTAVDEAAEQAVVRRIRATLDAFTLVSEELGHLRVGGPTRKGELSASGPAEQTDARAEPARPDIGVASAASGPWLVLDPIDGSLNAKRSLPHFALSLAVADGPTMADVHFGYVYDFGSGEEWTATRGEGAFLDGGRLDGLGPKDELEIVAFEGTTTEAIVERAAAMVGLAYRLRIMGSLALALCQLAAGRLDGVCSLKAARSVDIAAAQLLVRERGLAIELPEAPPFVEAPLDLVPRSRVVAAGTTELCRKLADALSG